MRWALVLLAACATRPPPSLEHHAGRQTAETYVLDAPLFTTTDLTSVIWTLERDGDNAHLVLGDREYTGTARGRDAFHAELGAVTMDCHRTEVRVHAATAEPEARAPHTACSVPRAWQPAELVPTTALACTVRRDRLTTEVTLAPAPGLQAVVDDCCDDEDRCERRWEIRRRR